MAIILHVDDSSFSRLQIGKILKKAGHEIIAADGGKNALDILQNRSPDLIISDILMPEMDGFGFLEALREAGNRVPVIMVTADIQKDTASICKELGALELFNKPPDEEQLLKTIQSITAKGE